MAYQTPTFLKSRFEGGDVPTQQDFTDLIDSTHPGYRTSKSLGDGSTDNQAILVAELAALPAGAALYLPPGTHNHAGILVLSGVTLFGAGSTSILAQLDPDLAPITLSGTGARLLDVKVTSPNAVARELIGLDGHAILVNGATDFVVDGCEATEAEQSGIFIKNSTNGRVTNNYVHDTFADGIHHTDVCKNIVTANNRIESTGDDCIAVVGYQSNSAQCEDIVISDNILMGGDARGITVVGSRRIGVRGNNIDTPTSMGILLGYDGTFVTRPCNDLVVSGNVIEAAGDSPNSNGAINLVGNGTQISSRIRISENVITNPRSRAITLAGAGTPGLENISITDNEIFNAVNPAINCDFVRDLRITDNTIDTCAGTAVTTGTSLSGVLQINGNIFRDTNTDAGAGTDVITVGNAASLTDIICIGNFRDGVDGVERGLEVSATSAVLKAYGNVFRGVTAANQNSTYTAKGSVFDGSVGVAADAGNNGATLRLGASEYIHVWNTALTADRAVTLNTNAWNGGNNSFRVVRTANATGAFNLNVGTGPLKALGAGEWCEVAYDGSAWFLIAFGSL